MILTRLPLFSYWTDFTPTIPKLYWDVYSQEDRIKKICCEFFKMTKYADKIAEQLNLTADEIEELQEEFTKFMESGFEDYYEEQIAAWVQENMASIMEQSMRLVYFGLTLDGYFVGYVPQGNAWDDVMFDTGQNYDNDKYGRLMLYYKTDSSSEVWQEE
jgi:hypothetical protein